MHFCSLSTLQTRLNCRMSRTIAPFTKACPPRLCPLPIKQTDRKSTRLNSSHGYISYAVFCLKKKKKFTKTSLPTTNTDTPVTNTYRATTAQTLDTRRISLLRSITHIYHGPTERSFTDR